MKVRGQQLLEETTMAAAKCAFLRRSLYWICAIGLVVIIGSNSAGAQSVNVSQVTGVIHDSTGAAIPGATVTITKTDTGLERTVVSGEDGAYSIPGLPVGPYSLKAALPGFDTYVRNGIVLQVGTNLAINVTLSVGGVNEHISVTADEVMVDPRSTAIGQVINSQQVTELPLNGRRATELILLSGLAAPAPAEDMNSNKNYPTQTISVAGGAQTGITFILDGGSHNDPFNNLNLPMPFPDALQEFKVESSALPARYGQHNAAAVNVVTRSGTNAFHGTVFEFSRHYRFNARNFFATADDGLRRNQFGGTLGGPIVQNRLFFFAAYQKKIEKTRPATALRYVPTAAMRSGDFTAFASAACNNGSAKTLKLPFVNNVTDPSNFSPAAMKLLSYVPVSTDPCGSYTVQIPNDNTEIQPLGKIDLKVTDKQNVFARYMNAVYDNPAFYDGKNALTLSRIGQHNVVHSAVLGHTWILSSNRLNAIHVTVSKTYNDRILKPFFSPVDLGVKVSAPVSGYTNVTITGTGFSIGTGATNPGFFDSTSYQIADDFDLTRGRHEISFGGNWIRTADLTEFYRFVNGENTFNGTIIGLPLADFMMGKSSGFNQTPPSRTNQLLRYYALYAQDAWRIRTNLTLNYGLRWEPYLAMQNRDNQVYLFDMARFNAGAHSIVYPNAAAGLYFPGDPGYPARAVTSNKLLNFAPRVGLAWSPSDRMTVRGAWGEFYDTSALFFNTGYQGFGRGSNLINPPGGFDDPYQGQPGGNPFPQAFTLTNGSTFNTFTGWATYPLHIHPTRLHQWNIGVQRQMQEWIVSASYLGNHTQHLWGGRQLNPAVYGPGATLSNTNQRRVLYLQNPVEGQYFGSVTTLDDTGTADYEGMLLSVQRRLQSNFSVLANWTLSKCMTDYRQAEYSSTTSPVDPAHPELDRGLCNSDRRNIVNLSGVLRTPKFKGGGALRRIASDWQLSPLVRWMSGDHSTPVTGVDTALTGQGGQRAVQVLSNPYGNKTYTNYLNPAAFTSAPPGTYSQLHPNTITNPANFQNDVALTRSFSVGEGRTLQFRWEVFNVTNRVNFGAPSSSLNSSNFGRITSAGDPRIMQFAGKFEF
jgi:hypothetical protein